MWVTRFWGSIPGGGSQIPDWDIGSASLLFNEYTNRIVDGRAIEPWGWSLTSIKCGGRSIPPLVLTSSYCLIWRRDMYIQLYDSKMCALWVGFEMLAALSCQFKPRQVHNKQPFSAQLTFILNRAGWGSGEGRWISEAQSMKPSIFYIVRDVSEKYQSQIHGPLGICTDSSCWVIYLRQANVHHSLSAFLKYLPIL